MNFMRILAGFSGGGVKRQCDASVTLQSYYSSNAVITIAIRLRYDYDASSARLLPFDASKK